MSVTKSVLSNAGAAVIQKTVRILDQLLLVPFFLTAWGAAYYGEWLTLTIIPSVLAFSDLGFGSAVSNSFVLAYAGGRKQEAADLNKAGFRIITGSVILGAILTAAVMIVGKRFYLFEKSLIPVHDAMLALVLMMVAKLISFYTQLIESYFRSTRKAAMGSLLSSGSSVINILAGFGILCAGGGVVGYATSQFIVAVLYTIIYYYIGSRLIDLRGYQGKVQKSDVKMIVSKGMGYLMSPVWQSIYFQGGTFVVRLTLGPESVAVFNTIRTVCRSVNQLYSIINSSIFPDLQYEYGCGNMTTVHRLYRIAIIFSIIIGLVGTLFLFLFGQEIYNRWTCNVLSVPIEVWLTFIIGILFNAVWWTAGVAYRMTNHPYHFAVVSTITACFSVGSSYILSKHLGLWGVTIGTVLFDAIMMIYVLPDSCRLLGMNVKELFLHIKEDGIFILRKTNHFKN